jgi:hypothetical protein
MPRMLLASLQRTWLSDVQVLVRALITECLPLRNITDEEATHSTNPFWVQDVVALQENIKQTLKLLEPLVKDISAWFDSVQFAGIKGNPGGECPVEYNQVAIRDGIRMLVEVAKRIQDVLDGLPGAPTLRLSIGPSLLASAATTPSRKPRPRSIVSPESVKTVETFMERKSLTQEQFVGTWMTTRSLREFLRTGKLGRRLFQDMAKRMGLSTEQLLDDELPETR